MLEDLVLYATRVVENWRRLGEASHADVFLVFFVMLLLLTYLHRGRRSWSVRATLGALATVTLVHLNFAVMPVLYVAVDALRQAHDGLGLPRLPATTWASLPTWAVALVAAVAHDFVNYWNHRLMHHRLLWPVHAIHHSEPDVNGLTSFRVHALEPFVMFCSHVVLLTWLSLPADALGLLGLLLVLHNMYVHTDVDWSHGPLRLLIASPRYHRWHHADVPEAYGKNLANVVPVFDVIFGTYHCPGPCDAPLGATGVPQNHPLKLFLYPGVAWLGQVRGALTALRRRATSNVGAGVEASVASTGRSPAG